MKNLGMAENSSCITLLQTIHGHMLTPKTYGCVECRYCRCNISVLVGNGHSPYQEWFCRVFRPDFFSPNGWVLTNLITYNTQAFVWNFSKQLIFLGLNVLDYPNVSILWAVFRFKKIFSKEVLYQLRFIYKTL